MFFVFAFLISVAPSAWASQVHISVVSGGNETAFYGRYISGDGVVVVTPGRPEGAKASMSFSFDSNLDLYVMEPYGDMPERVRGELYRYGRLVFFQAEPGHHEHGIDYHEKVDLVLKQPGARRVENSNFDFNLDSIPLVQHDPDQLKDWLMKLSGEDEVLVKGKLERIAERGSSSGRRLAREFLRKEYERLGYNVRFEGYRSGWNRGTNFIAEKIGADPSRVIVVGAHFDSVNNAGADDDGAGVIASLAIARDLAELKLPVTVRFLGFDQEEKGLVGSKAYVAQLAAAGEDQKVVGSFFMEMVGYDSDDDGAFHIVTCPDTPSLELANLIDASILQQKLPLKSIRYCTNRSDHRPFWNRGIPAILISQNFFSGDPNPCYHKSCDRVDILNFQYMARLSSGMSGAIQAFLKSL